MQKVISGTSPEVLQEYFHGKNLLKEIEDFQELKAREKAENYKICIADKIIELEANAGNIVSDFRKVFTLTRERALQSLFDRIGHIEDYSYLLQDLEKLEIEKDYDAVFYFLSKEPDFINEICLVYSLNSHTESYWNRRRTGIIKRTNDITKQEINILKEVIQEKLKETTRGKNCNIQHILFDGKDHLFVMAEDIAVTIQLWQGGVPEDVLIKPSFDLAFVYDRYEGELDICCVKGGTHFRNKMQLAFSKAVLGKEIQELKDDDEIYDLPYIFQQLLENKRVDFNTSAGRNVKDIFIRAIKLKGQHFHNGIVTLDTGLNQGHSDNQSYIYSEIEKFIKIKEASPNTVNIEDLKITWIECRVIYYDILTKEICRKKFNISGSSGCNLSFDGIDKEIRECLKEAKIQLPRVEDEKQQAA